MYTLFVDESTQRFGCPLDEKHREHKVFGMGGVLVKRTDEFQIEKNCRAFKRDVLGIADDIPIHWNLDDTERNKDHEILRSSIVKKWGVDAARNEYHKEILNFLSQQSLEIITVLCEDARYKPFGRRKQNMDPNIAFYPNALKWLMQRFSFLLLAQKNPTSLGRLILDKPSGGEEKIKEYRMIHRSIWRSGFPHLPNPIRPLRCLIESDLSICSANNHNILQLADIAVGCTAEWAKGNLNRRADSHIFMLVIKDKFWKGTKRDQVLQRGLIGWPHDFADRLIEWWDELVTFAELQKSVVSSSSSLS